MTRTATTVMATTAEHRMISKHTPVPFLLEAFPVPPSHIPVNPPPSLPPAAPLPPLPPTSTDTILFIRRSSSIRSQSSSASDPQSPIRNRARNGSLSSLRSFHRNPSCDLTHPISEEGPYNIHSDSIPDLPDSPRSESPDVSAIIQATPRPRSRPRPNKSRPRVTSVNGNRSSGLSKYLPNPHEFELELENRPEDAPDSDSSIDLHTPLP